MGSFITTYSRNDYVVLRNPPTEELPQQRRASHSLVVPKRRTQQPQSYKKFKKYGEYTKIPRDSNTTPNKPSSSFIIFIQYNLEKIYNMFPKDERPPSGYDISRKASQLWKEMTEKDKQPYKEEYQYKLKLYNQKKKQSLFYTQIMNHKN